MLIPAHMQLAWRREFCFLLCDILGKGYVKSIQPGIGRILTFVVFILERGEVFCFKPEDEERRFSIRVGIKCARSMAYSEKISSRLVCMTDQIYDFIQNNVQVNGKNFAYMKKIILDYLPYHLAVQWSADYLSRKETKNLKEKMKLLRSSWKYSEKTYPLLDKWLKTHGAIQNFSLEELCRYISGEKNLNISARQRNHIYAYYGIHKHEIIFGEKAKKLQATILSKDQQYNDNQFFITGLSISSGKVKGNAQVIRDIRGLNTIIPGKIIVIPAARPQYYHLLRQALAIITDEGGGILSHAAIISREYRIPCIIGTKNATRQLQSGDLVEVDAYKGRVRKISI